MNITKYWKSLDPKEKRALADSCDKSKEFLSNVFYGGQIAGPGLVKVIIRETGGLKKDGGLFEHKDFRPDDYE